jgi:hypothetical protein
MVFNYISDFLKKYNVFKENNKIYISISGHYR